MRKCAISCASVNLCLSGTSYLFMRTSYSPFPSEVGRMRPEILGGNGERKTFKPSALASSPTFTGCALIKPCTISASFGSIRSHRLIRALPFVLRKRPDRIPHRISEHPRTLPCPFVRRAFCGEVDRPQNLYAGKSSLQKPPWC